MAQSVKQQLDQFTSMLYAFAYKLTGNYYEAQDLYQDTAVRVITNADKFKQGTNFKAWSSTIMRNIFINNYRRKKSRNVIIDTTDNGYYMDSGKHQVINDGISKVNYDELMMMVEELPVDLKTPFMLRYKGFKYDEIASELELPLGTVKSRIFLARRALRDRYNKINLALED